MAQFNETASIVPITIFGNKGDIAFFPTGTLTSSFTPEEIDNAQRTTASFVITSNTSSKALQFIIPSESAGQPNDVIGFHFTSSGANARVGIGTNNPLTVFDFKDVEDSSIGTELLLRSSRTTEGAQVGDSAGLITFAIDSASFENLKVSGSIATIEAVVSDVDVTGVTGDLILSTANVKSENPIQRIKIGVATEITGALNLSAGITAQAKISSSTLETSGFLSAGSLGVGTTIPPGANALKVEGNASIDGNTTLGSPGSTTTVTGSFKTNGTVYVPGVEGSSATDNVAVIDSGYLQSASVDAKIFANPNTLVSRNAVGATINQIPIYTADTTILTGSNSLLFDPGTLTLTAPGLIATADLFATTARIATTNISTTNLTASIISVSGDITGSDVYINDWGSVSASLATTVNTSGTPTNNQLAIFTDPDTIEGDSDLTWDGSIFTINGTGSVDLLQVDDKLQGNGSGFQFFAFNEDTVKVKFANWYSSNDRQYGMGQLWFETWFAAIDNNANPALRDERRIGFYLEEPDAGASDAAGGTGVHPSNARFYVDVNGAYLSGSFTASADISASGDIITNTLTASSALVENTLQFQTQSTPPTAVAGALYVDSDNNLYIGQ